MGTSLRCLFSKVTIYWFITHDANGGDYDDLDGGDGGDDDDDGDVS